MLWIGNLFRFDNLLFEITLMMPNIIFHTMEMKYVLCKTLVMNIGEIGPVELELILFTLIFVVGGLIGADS
jgi:hypothetical protein